MNDQARLRITPDHFAYLKISEGCDRTCTFCAIPKMRGKHITKPIEMVIAEATELAKDGVRELNIVAQDTTYYGLDLYGEVRLVQLLRELEKVDGIDWIRLMYLYPINFSDELIDTISGSGKIIPYLDMPLQHINDTMLRRMQRRVNRAELVGRGDEQHAGEVDGHLQVVVPKPVVLGRVEDLEERGGRVALVSSRDLVDLVQHEDRVHRLRLLEGLHDPPGDGPDVRAPMSANLGFVPQIGRAHV